MIKIMLFIVYTVFFLNDPSFVCGIISNKNLVLPFADCCEEGNGPSGSIKSGEFLD
jgi:hypothetical protein